MSNKVTRKIVDVYPNGPIFTVIPPIMSNAFKVDLSIGDIANCINARAIVKETLIDGRVISIGLSNYDIDNNEGIKLPEKKKEIEVRESRVSTPVEEEIIPPVTMEKPVQEEVEEDDNIEEEQPVEEEIESMVEDTPENKYQNNNKGKNNKRR